MSAATHSEETAARREELRQSGKGRVAERVAECEQEGLEYYVCEVAPQMSENQLATLELK